MAREVNSVLAQILAEGRGVSEAKGEEIVKNMRAANQYQVRLRQDTTNGRSPEAVTSGTVPKPFIPPSQIFFCLLTDLFAGGRLVVKKQSARGALFGIVAS